MIIHHINEYCHQYTRTNNNLPSTKSARKQAANTFAALLMIGCEVSSDDDPSKPVSETMKTSSSSLQSPSASTSYNSYIDVLDDWVNVDDDKDSDYLAAIEASLKDQNNETLTFSVSEEEVKDILSRFISKTIVNTDGDDMLNILVSRKAILQCTLRAIERKSFSFERPVLVSFAGEDGMDAGGPKREFFRLLMQSLKGIGIFDGSGWFVHDLSLLKQRKYELAGKLISWSILQGGTGPKCLAVEALCIAQDKPIDQEKVIEIVCDVKLKEILKALKAAKDEEFPNLIKKHGDDIAEYGYSAIYTSKSSDKQKIVDCLLKQSFLFSVYAEVEQFRKGMNMVGGFGDIVFESYPVFQSVLGNNQDKLTSNVIKANYKVCFSEAGSNNKD